MTDIAGGLAARFDAVIYSVSGDPSYPDALLIGARAVRSAVLVIRLGHDTADLVRRAKDSLERAGVEILGYALLDNQTSFWAPKVSWTPWGKTGVGKVQSFAG